MPLTKNQFVIHTIWSDKREFGFELAIDEALADLPDCRIVSMHVQGYFIFLVVEFV
jgi:hypothetical protein